MLPMLQVMNHWKKPDGGSALIVYQATSPRAQLHFLYSSIFSELAARHFHVPATAICFHRH
jgi:hypothetical protein